MDAETLVKAVLDEQIEVTQLSGEQMEELVDYMWEAAEAMLGGPNDAAAQAMLELIDVIGNEAEHRIVAMDTTDFEADIEASVARGNTYFALEDYVVQ
jgi:hypothetical protein